MAECRSLVVTEAPQTFVEEWAPEADTSLANPLRLNIGVKRLNDRLAADVLRGLPSCGDINRVVFVPAMLQVLACPGIGQVDSNANLPVQWYVQQEEKQPK